MEEQNLNIARMVDRFCLNITSMRATRGFTVRELSERTGVSSGALNAYETGRSKPSLEYALRIAACFNTDLMDMLNIDF